MIRYDLHHRLPQWRASGRRV